MLIYKIYECDNDNIINGNDQCIIGYHDDNYNNDHDTVLLHSSNTKMPICCKIINNNITKNIVLVKPWVLIQLGVNHGNNIDIMLLNSICPHNIMNKIDISLSYMSCLTYKHWDENNNNDNWQFMKSYHVTHAWPSTLNLNAIKLLMPSLIYSKNIVNNCTIAIDALDSILLFQVTIKNYNDNIALCIYNMNNISIEIIDSVIVSDNMSIESSRSNQKTLLSCSYMSNILKKLYLLCDINIYRNHDNSILNYNDYWNGIKSILIIGPEGSGKTAILESVSNYAIELNDINNSNTLFLSCENIIDYSHDRFKQFDSINGAQSNDDPNEYINELIDTLCNVLGGINSQSFQKAHEPNNKPILILIDNLNKVLLASEKSDIRSETGLNYQTVAVYLRRLLNKISDRHVSNRKILIIGTTSLPLSIVYAANNNFPDFDSYLSIPRPSAVDRQMLLSSMFKQNSILQNVEIAAHSYIDDLANLTRGYLPGDLAAVVRRIASTHCEIVSGDRALDWSKVLSAVASMPPKQLQTLDMLSGNSFNMGSGDIKSLCWDDFAGYNDIKKKLIQILSTKKTSKIQTSSMPHGILLHGSSGCGKTFLAKVIAAESHTNFVYVRSTEILSKYFGETEETLRKLFEKARAAAPCVLFFDEFDALAFKRGLNGDESSSDAGHSLHNRILSTFLNEMDGILSLDDGSTEGGVLVLAACNDIDSIDEGLLRPGRFQYHLKLNLPSPDDVHDILQRYLSKINYSSDIVISEIASAFLAKIKSPSAAEIGSLCKAAIFVALHETISSGNETINKVSGKHFKTALND